MRLNLALKSNFPQRMVSLSMSDCVSIFQTFLCFILVLYFSVSFPISLHLAAIVCNRVL